MGLTAASVEFHAGLPGSASSLEDAERVHAGGVA